MGVSRHPNTHHTTRKPSKMGSKNGKPVLRDEDVVALSKTSGMDEAEVRSSFDQFVTEHPNGKMKKKDFREMMEKALPAKDAAKMDDHVFRIYDKNNDGVIDFVEFMVVYHIMSEGAPEEVLRQLFRVFDVNNDGSINNKEMKRLVKDMMGLIKDVDNPEEATKEMIASSAFSEMDKDEDGKVTVDEFVTACLSQEQCSKMLALKVIDIFVDN